jgi:hypothetical protein
MAVGDFWSGTAPSSISTTASDAGMGVQPAWQQDYTRAMLGNAVTQIDQPYQAYTGARIAGQDPLSGQASTLAQSNVGAWQPSMDYAQGKAYDNVQNYMNPYQNQVVDRIAQLGQQNLTQNLMPQVNSTFNGSGQFGSTRNADFMGRALADTQREVLGQQGQLLNTGYNQAMQAFNTDATRIANVAQNAATLGAADVTQLDTLGRVNQAQNQQNLDLNYLNFKEQNEAPRQNLAFMNDLIRGLPTQTSSYQTQTRLPEMGSTQSPLQQAAAAFAGTKAILSPTQQAAQQTTGIK